MSEKMPEIEVGDWVLAAMWAHRPRVVTEITHAGTRIKFGDSWAYERRLELRAVVTEIRKANGSGVWRREDPRDDRG